MEDGYIKLYRHLKESRAFANEGLLKVWVWCLLKANYKDKWVSVKTGRSETEVLVLKGSFIFGRKSAGKELNMPPSTVWKRIIKLKNIGNLNIESNTHYSIISIVNWATYQGEEIKGDIKGDRQGTGKEQASDTNKKEKKDKKKKDIYGNRVKLTKEEHKKLTDQFGESITKEKITDLDLYMGSKGKKYSDHYLTILAWDRKDKKTNAGSQTQNHGMREI